MQDEVIVARVHCLHEDSPDEIGRSIPGRMTARSYCSVPSLE